jgi:drug/metabolite transporter (DMT)-like permease
MKSDRITLIASAITLATGVIWGLYWLPVRALADRGFTGAWGTLVITLGALVVLAPGAYARRHDIARSPKFALFSIALGGAAFALYSIGFLYGRVALIILLWCLTPVWSTLIARFIMGWPTPALRIVAMIVGIVGLALMLGAGGGLPLPRNLGEWMSLLGGLLWSIASTGMRAKSTLQPGPSAFVFALGAAAACAVLVPFLQPAPTAQEAQSLLAPLALALVSGALWWGLSLAALMWATQRIDPARVGILMMTEVVVGAASAAALAHETLSTLEMAGGALVLAAGVLELWPAKPAQREHT